MISRKRLKEKFKEKQYRDAYIKRSNREYIAYQIRKIRGTKTQTEFADMLGTRQTIISRIENPNYEGITLNTITNPNYEGITLNTITELAAKSGLAVYIEIVTPNEFIEMSRIRTEKE